MKRVAYFILFAGLLLTLTGCSAGARPLGGATYTGTIAVPAEKGSNATIGFTTSDDGNKITNISIILTNVRYPTTSAGSLMQTVSGDFVIQDNKINIQTESLGTVTSKFTSKTEASGNIYIAIKNQVMGSTISCELGSWKWRASTNELTFLEQIHFKRTQLGFH